VIELDGTPLFAIVFHVRRAALTAKSWEVFVIVIAFEEVFAATFFANADESVHFGVNALACALTGINLAKRQVRGRGRDLVVNAVGAAFGAEDWAEGIGVFPESASARGSGYVCACSAHIKSLEVDITFHEK
jgi:hypothetical protein